jgi:aminopeptidase N
MKSFIYIITLIFYLNNIFAQRTADFQVNENSRLIYDNIKQSSLLNKYDIKFCRIDISVSDTCKFISGNVAYLSISQSNSLDTFLLQLSDDYVIDSVIFNKSNVSFTHTDDEIRVNVSPALNYGDTINVCVYYSGTPVNEPNNRGITNSTDSTYFKKVTFTLSEPYFALNWFPCKQELSDKIDSAYIFITVDSTLKAGSNGILKSVSHLPGNKLRYEWKTYYPIDYYLLSFSVSDYYEYDFYAKPGGSGDSVFVQNFIYGNCLNNYKYYIDQTSEYMDYFSGLFGYYPFSDEKYGHTMIPVSGGMEHQTMTSLGYFDLTVVSHELSHQWFGNSTTCNNWQDIWLNEGFASYCEYLANDKYSGNGPNCMETAHNYALSKPSGSVYIPFESLNDHRRIFDYALTYQKGAAIIHQLRYELDNDSLFYLGLRNYLAQYKYKTASFSDFKSSFENTAQKDFTYFFDQWYYGYGYPMYSINWYQNNDTLYIHCVQSASSDSTKLFKSSLEFKIYSAGENNVVRVFQDTNSVNYKLYIPEHVDSITIDPDSWLIKKILYIKQGIDPLPVEKTIIVPNPFTDEIIIENGNNYSEKYFEIFDIRGNKLISVNSKSKIVRIKTANLKKGIYILKINGNKGLIKKMVKI